MNFTRLFDIIDFQQKKYPNKESLNSFVDGKWKHHSTQSIRKEIDHISTWMLNNGIQKSDKIAIMPHIGRPAWMMIDFACLQIGGIMVPLHPTSPMEDTRYIIEQTNIKMCIVADEALFYKLSPIFKNNYPDVLLYHIVATKENYFPALINGGKEDLVSNDLEKIKQGVSPENIAAIMYTSGTSGQPKGVVLTHKNIVSNVLSALALLPIGCHRKALSFLPFSHVFERTVTYTYMAAGISIYFAQDRAHLRQDFKEVKPCLFTTVPRILEKMYDIIREKAYEQNFLIKSLIFWSIKVGKQYPSKKGFAPLYGLKHIIARLLVLNKWKKNLGGQVRYIIVGAASLQPNIARLFAATGIKIREGYGMTEAAPFITTNRFEPGMNRVGTVGIPVPGVEVKINDPDKNGDGEILVKGPNIMKGYYKKETLTKQVFTDDGWFKTGDVGHFEHKRFLKITGRKKHIFKTSAGKYIAPQQLQNHFTSSSYIQQCLIIGFQRPFVTALIVPNYTLLKIWSEKKGIHWTSPQFMAHNIKITGKIQWEIDLFNRSLSNFQRIKKFTLCHEEWTVENGLYSASYKPIRYKLMAQFEKEIGKMYLDK